jgi:hypothetical protein
MDDHTKRLEQVIATEREELSSNIEELASKARGLTDWRAQLEAHPAAALGLAAAGGAMAASMRRRRARIPRAMEEANQARETGAKPKARAFDTTMLMRDIKFALAGVATATVVEFLSDAIPGFERHYRPSGQGAQG